MWDYWLFLKGSLKNVVENGGSSTLLHWLFLSILCLFLCVFLPFSLIYRFLSHVIHVFFRSNLLFKAQSCCGLWKFPQSGSYSDIKLYTLLFLQREKKSLLKLLSSNKKKARPSPPSSPTLETEQAAAAGEVLQGAVGQDTSPPSGTASRLESETAASSSSSSSSVPESSHRKSTPVDGCAPIAPPPRQACSSLLSQQHDARPIICERYSTMM